MSKSFTLEEKVKHILGSNFVLERVRDEKFFEKKELLFMHKSKMRQIIIIIQTNGEQERIKQIMLLKRISETSSTFRNDEFYAYGLEKKQEIVLKKLKLVKTKLCLTQIFL